MGHVGINHGTTDNNRKLALKEVKGENEHVELLTKFWLKTIVKYRFICKINLTSTELKQKKPLVTSLRRSENR